MLKIRGENYKRKKCDEVLKERYFFSGKYESNQNDPYEICIIYPTNNFDTEKLVEIANYYKIPIIYDVNSFQNEIKTQHIKINFSKFNKIVQFDSKSKLVTLEPGVKIFNLLNFLEKFNLTIPDLEKYKFSALTISDILFNNFYSFNEGSFLDDSIHEIFVVTPRNNRVMSLKQNDDLTLTGLNMKNLFLHTNSTLGLIIQVKMKTKKIKDYKFLSIENLENSLDDFLLTLETLKENKKLLGLQDLVIVNKNYETDLILKVKSQFLTNCVELLKSTNIHFENITKDSFLKYLAISNKNNFDVVRKLKVHLNSKSISDFLITAKNLANKYEVDMQFRCSFLRNELEMIIRSRDDLKSIENAYKYISKMHSYVLKHEGNIFGKFLIKYKKFNLNLSRKFITY